jgi:hypothetical protein
MLKTLEDLIQHSARMADRLPAIESEVRLSVPGVSASEAARILSALPGLPDSYMRVAESITLCGKSIGCFQLAPCSHPGNSLFHVLRGANSSASNPHAERFRGHGVYQVASWEADPIAVVCSAGKANRGHIVLYDHEEMKRPARLLAEDFQQFLLLAGNLDDIRDRYADSDPERAIKEFKKVIAMLVTKNPDAIADAWDPIADVVLG